MLLRGQLEKAAVPKLEALRRGLAFSIRQLALWRPVAAGSDFCCWLLALQALTASSAFSACCKQGWPSAGKLHLCQALHRSKTRGFAARTFSIQQRL